MSIPVFRPSIKRKEMDAVLTCLVSDRLGPGSFGENLVQDLLDKTDYDGGIVLRDRIRGIEIGLRALQLEKGARVGLCALADRSYYYCLEAMGYETVLIDSEEAFPRIDLASLETIHSQQALQALILDHPLGFLPDMERLGDLSLPILQDISSVMSSSPQSHYIGDFLLLSLEPENLITCGGGVFLAARSRKESKALTAAVQDIPNDIYMPDMNAALGTMQVRELGDFLRLRGEIFEILSQSVLQSRHRLLSSDERPIPSFLGVMVATSVQELIHYGVKKQVEIRPAFENSIIHHMMKDFDAASDQGSAPAELFPMAARFSLRSVLLPLYPSLSRKDVEHLQKLIKTLP